MGLPSCPANRGSTGIDGNELRRPSKRERGRTAFLRELEGDLKARPTSPTGETGHDPQSGWQHQRPLGIPTIRDRVAQMAVKLVIEPIFEADFCANSYGFRPKKSAHDAVDDIANTLWAGYTQVIDADLSKYFDSIPHAKLLAVVAERIVDGGILASHQAVAQSPGHRRRRWVWKKTGGGGKGNRKGTPQGGVISPLLANSYLHILDRIWERHRLKGKLAAHLVRYADDFVVHVPKRGRGTAESGAPSPGTTGPQPQRDQDPYQGRHPSKLQFPGIHDPDESGGEDGKTVPECPAVGQILKKIKTRLTELTQRELTPIPLKDLVRNVNRSLRGWANYFHYRNSSMAMSKVRIMRKSGCAPI